MYAAVLLKTSCCGEEDSNRLSRSSSKRCSMSARLARVCPSVNTSMSLNGHAFKPWPVLHALRMSGCNRIRLTCGITFDTGYKLASFIDKNGTGNFVGLQRLASRLPLRIRKVKIGTLPFLRVHLEEVADRLLASFWILYVCFGWISVERCQCCFRVYKDIKLNFCSVYGPGGNIRR